MKTILAVLVLFSQLSNAQAFESKRRAVVRDENYKAIIDEVNLTELTSEVGYEGKYFKIVNGKSNEAVRFDESEELQLKAATTYYHLNKARKYFAEVAKSKYVQELPQLTVRIELLNVFNELGHFANDNLTPQYNNALSIPAGKGYPSKNIEPWEMEIWFRPSKEVNIKDFPGAQNGAVVKTALLDFRNQTHMTNFKQFMTILLQGDLSGDPSNLLRVAGSSLLMEFVYQTSDIATDFFSRKIYRLDSALVPEIIYHEFSHVALSEYLELTHSTPVNEGMADFFAGKIANSKKLALKIKDYNLFNGKEVKKKQQYNLAFERGDFANADFVFGLLWNVGRTVGEDIEIQFMNNLASKLHTNATIRDELINATLETCKTSCKSPLNDRLKLYRLYNAKNL
jgi:hypothetical protein